MPRREVLTRRHALVCALLLAPSLLMSTAAWAADWPERTIRMIVPFVAGAGADTVGRTFAEELAKALGQPVVVDNKGGAGGLIGTAEGARAPADGYTLLLTSQGTTVFNIGPLQGAGLRSAKGPHPGRRHRLPPQRAGRFSHEPGHDRRRAGGTGARQADGTHLRLERHRQQPPHVGREPWSSARGVKLQHVPYRGAPAAVLAVMNGEVTMGFFNTPTVLGQIKAGKLKALAVTSQARVGPWKRKQPSPAAWTATAWTA